MIMISTEIVKFVVIMLFMGSSSGASVRTVYVPVSKASAYKKIFTAKITGNKGSMTVRIKK